MCRKFRSLKLFGFIIMVLLIAGCSSSSQYHTRSTEIAAIVYATQTAQANKPTPTPASIERPDWSVVLFDRFDSNESGWPAGRESNDFINNRWIIMSGKYQWMARAYQNGYWFVYPDQKSVSDFYLSADAQRLEGPENCTYGVVFRVFGENSFYMFGISDTQSFMVYRLYRGNWEALVDWNPSSAIQPGEVNRLTVIAQDSHFMFWINNQMVAEIEDDKITTGRAGLIVELYNADDEALFEFDNFELRQP